MRIYSTCSEAKEEVLRDLVQFGRVVKPRTQQNMRVDHTDQWWTIELQAYSFSVIDDHDWKSATKDPAWVESEFAERVNTTPPYHNPGTAWQEREAYWTPYLNRSAEARPEFDYSYNERLGPHLLEVIEALRFDPFTRTAVLSVFSSPLDHAHLAGKRRVPCTLAYQFMFRDSALDIVAVMRSCDYFEHFCNDLALAILLKRHVAKEADVKPGRTMMFISSLHAFKKDLPPRYHVF